ncbi:MAG: single-stranded-DNA-specific exonuclease RecJ [Rikenellaceae bacterium]
MPIEKNWVVKPKGSQAKIEELSSALAIAPVLAELLLQRGIDSVERAKEFFSPQLSMLHDPFLMKDMDRAVERIEKALAAGEGILVYGDYDVDGTTAVALMYKFLRQIGHRELSFYIPDRYTEGYGISIKGIDHAARKGVGLIIALDCGIKAIEKVVYAKSKGIDVIICDHHLPAEEIPQAAAVLDPKRVDCSYPFDELSGCGVGFKLAQAYAQRHGIPFSQIEPLLDLLVVSIASDIVPLVDENRVLAHYGLLRLNRKPSKGLHSIIKICGLDRTAITIDDIVFKIGPRINAAGRMRMDESDENAAPSGGYAVVHLLVEGNESAAAESGEQIDAFNQDRKSIDRSVTQEAHDYIENNPELKARKCTVIYNPKWMKGIVGIVASRLIESYYRPTVVLTMSNGFVTGSARSIPGFDLYQAVESCSDLLENFGGHMYAAGLALRPENVEEFTRRFNAYVEENIDPQILVPQVDIDAELLFSQVTPEFRRRLNSFQPFGPGNTAPVFITRGVSNHGDVRLVGADCEHLRMDLTQREKPNTRIPAIAFSQPTHFLWIREGKPIDVCYQVVENHYRGTVSTQLRVKDIKPVYGKADRDFEPTFYGKR